MGRYKEAIEQFKKALTYDPSNFEASKQYILALEKYIEKIELK
jgi:tetratricopeptide (TPR) repeat protein